MVFLMPIPSVQPTINTANGALVGYHQLRDRHHSPIKADVKRKRIFLRRAFDHLQTSHECRVIRVKRLWQKREVSWIESMMRKRNQKSILMLSCLILRKCIQMPLC